MSSVIAASLIMILTTVISLLLCFIQQMKIMDVDGNWYSSYESLPTLRQATIAPSIFPPPPSVAKELQLRRCLRIFPHQQDTGGFFIAVLEKSAPLHSKEKIFDDTGSEKNGVHNDEGMVVGAKTTSNDDLKPIRYRKVSQNEFFPMSGPIANEWAAFATHLGISTADVSPHQLMMRSKTGPRLFIAPKEIVKVLNADVNKSIQVRSFGQEFSVVLHLLAFVLGSVDFLIEIVSFIFVCV